jgi:hypothetical protein
MLCEKVENQPTPQTQLALKKQLTTVRERNQTVENLSATHAGPAHHSVDVRTFLTAQTQYTRSPQIHRQLIHNSTAPKHSLQQPTNHPAIPSGITAAGCHE